MKVRMRSGELVLLGCLTGRMCHTHPVVRAADWTNKPLDTAAASGMGSCHYREAPTCLAVVFSRALVA